MCEFCSKHGDGKIWFKNAANYANDLMADINRRSYIKDFFSNTIETGIITIGRLETIYQKKKFLPDRLVRQIINTASEEHFGQVVTIEDIREIVVSRMHSTWRLDNIPRLYETEKIPLQEKFIYLHFLIGGSDWYVAEFDGEDIFFGYVVLNGDFGCAEWGYFSFSELKEIRIGGWLEVDCELESCWLVKVFSKIYSVIT